MRQKFRVYGISKLTGTRKYLSWRKYKDSIFFNTISEPQDYKSVVGSDFIAVQLAAQKELNNVKWEVEPAIKKTSKPKPEIMAAVSDCWDKVTLTKSN